MARRQNLWVDLAVCGDATYAKTSTYTLGNDAVFGSENLSTGSSSLFHAVLGRSWPKTGSEKRNPYFLSHPDTTISPTDSAEEPFFLVNRTCHSKGYSFAAAVSPPVRCPETGNQVEHLPSPGIILVFQERLNERIGVREGARIEGQTSALPRPKLPDRNDRAKSWIDCPA